MNDVPPSSFTGRQRNRKTHWSVKAKDKLSHAIITVAGLGTILAVSTVFVFLVSVVFPLFRAPTSEKASSAPIPMPEGVTAAPVHMAMDEYNLLAWAVYPDGMLRKFRLDTGELLEEVPLVRDGVELTAWSFPQRDSLAVLGFSDGSVRFANIEFTLSFREMDDLPEEYRSIAVGELILYEKNLAQRTPQGQLRINGLSVSLEAPIATGSDQPVVLLDHTRSRNVINYAAMTADGRVFLQRARGQMNMMTRQVRYTTTTAFIDYEPRHESPAYVKLTGLGDNVYMIWRDGVMHRYDTRVFENISRVETLDLTPEPGVDITAIDFMIGKTTLLVGDSRGGVTGWFRVRPAGVEADSRLTVRMRELDLGPDGFNRGDVRDIRVADIRSRDQFALVPARRMEAPQGNSPVISLTPSVRKRIFAAGHADGRVRVHNTTVEALQLENRLLDGNPAAVVALNPRDNGLAGISEQGNFTLWHVDLPHSEATFAGYFRPIWYEGSNEPSHTWQSTGGTDDFEPKFGLMPLIFGTVKATVYSMLIAVPIALLAAIYTSEFLHPKAKARIKPAIEMMASLPSVVLGFLAGLVLAQFIEVRVPATLLSFLTIPFTLVFLAAFWQLQSRTGQLKRRALRFPIMFLAVPLGLLIAGELGPRVERALFAVEILDREVAEEMVSDLPVAEIQRSRDGNLIVRDFRLWLSANRQDADDPKFASSPLGGWLILLLPLSCFLVVFGTVKYGNPILLQHAAQLSPRQFAILDLVKFIVAGSAAVLLALTLSWLIGDGFGWDLRGGIIGQYNQRNALVVGLMMGFAVVPIIYTIADDAMSAVPENLRSASLGAGATKWQTAVRIIIPTSMSGLFSAVMIGFGRVVGETMIVLMATGNTPIMEWNIFSGFRTLSANIAVEMMEAVEGSTNYRTLFLAAVILFTLTFIINTIAEKIRQSYRKKAYQL
jgi:phosphate transport system permease protein